MFDKIEHFELIKSFHKNNQEKIQKFAEFLKKKEVREYANEEIDHSFDAKLSVFENLSGNYNAVKTRS